MVKFQSLSRFYSRTSAGKFQLDVHQIRAAFAQAEELPERLRNLRLDRVSRILGGESPTKIGNLSQVLVVHLIPYAAFDPSFRVDLHAAKDDKKSRLRPIGDVSGWRGAGGHSVALHAFQHRESRCPPGARAKRREWV